MPVHRLVSEEQVRELEEKVRKLEEENRKLYTQRSMLVAALAVCFPSGKRDTTIEGWDPEWHGCCYIDLPYGQVSFHYPTWDAHLFEKIPPYTKPWDGHDADHAAKCIQRLRTGDETRWLIPWIEERRVIANTCVDLHANETGAIYLWMDEFEKVLLREAIARRRNCSREDV